MNGNGTWIRWMLGILIVIAMAVSSYAVNKADNAVCKEDYQRDQQRINQSLKDLNDKMDRMIGYLIKEK